MNLNNEIVEKGNDKKESANKFGNMKSLKKQATEDIKTKIWVIWKVDL